MPGEIEMRRRDDSSGPAPARTPQVAAGVCTALSSDDLGNDAGSSATVPLSPRPPAAID